MKTSTTTELAGLPVSSGIAIGRAVCLSDENREVLRFQLPEDELRAEVQRFHQGRQSALGELLKAQERIEQEFGDELAGILEAQAMLLADDSFIRRVEGRINDQAINAEWAVLRTCEELAERFAQIDNEYLRDRGDDLHSISRYLLHSLRGISHHEISEIEGDVVVVADELTPADALRLARQQVVGFALESGGQTSHTAIIARGLNLPAVFGIEGVTEAVTDQAPIILDGDAGRVILHPTPEMLDGFTARRAEARELEAELAETRGIPSLSRDGIEVTLLANLELPEEIAYAQRFGCAGVGLYRSEFFYIERSPELPSEEEQFELFSTLLEAMAPAPVTVRTLDLGGRKLAEQLMSHAEENPVLGLRGIRLTLARPEILKTQVRALLRAAVSGDLRIMIPLVTTIDETRSFQKLCRECAQELEAEGVEHRSDVPLGAMIEVPAAALVTEHFADELDFLSIGTNDLIQYALAVDRNNEHVAPLYQPSHPAILRLLEQICRGALARSCELSICGEMAADPVLTPFLLGLGLRLFSMSPRSIPVIKKRVWELEIMSLQETVEECLNLRTAEEIRALLCAKHSL